MIKLPDISIVNEKFSPIYSVRHVLISGILSSILVFLLLFIFQPFRIYEHSFIWRLFLSFVYSTIPCLLYFTSLLLFRKRIKRGVFIWNLREEFLYFFLNFFIAGILVYIYSYLIMDVIFPFKFKMPKNFFLKSIYYSLIFGFIIYMLSKTHDLLAYFCITKNGTILKTSSRSKQLLIFFSNSNNIFKFYISEILMIESSINDIIVYQLNNHHINRIFIKNVSLKEIEKKYSFPKFSLLRCHKSFLVNFNHIKFMRGNARTTVLKLKGDFFIPVSRKKINLLKKLLRK